MNKENNKIANIKELMSLFYPEKYRAPYLQLIFFGILGLCILIGYFIGKEGTKEEYHKNNIVKLAQKKQQEIKDKKNQVSKELDQKEDDFNKIRAPLIEEKSRFDVSIEEAFKARDLERNAKDKEEFKNRLNKVEKIIYKIENGFEISNEEDALLQRESNCDFHFDIDLKSAKTNIDVKLSKATDYTKDVKLLESLSSLTPMQQSELQYKRQYIANAGSMDRTKQINALLMNIAKNPHPYTAECLIRANRIIPILLKYRELNDPEGAYMMQKYFGVAKNWDLTIPLIQRKKGDDSIIYYKAHDKCLEERNAPARSVYSMNLPEKISMELAKKYPYPLKDNQGWSYNMMKNYKPKVERTKAPYDIILPPKTKDYTERCVKTYSGACRQKRDAAVKRAKYAISVRGAEDQYLQCLKDLERSKEVIACNNKFKSQEVQKAKDEEFKKLNSEESVNCVKKYFVHFKKLAEFDKKKRWWE